MIGEGHEVVGLDNLNDYYDVNLKKARLAVLQESDLFRHVNINLQDDQPMSDLLHKRNLRMWLTWLLKPVSDIPSRIPSRISIPIVVGFLNILEGCRHNKVEHLSTLLVVRCTA